MPKLSVIVLVALGLTLSTACEKTNHANIDKWTSSQKGLGKLKSALRSGGLDPDLSAHAAENLYKRGNDEDVKAAFESMAPARRQQVLAKLAPRLWAMARLDGEMAKPSPIQEAGKDALFELRQFADDANRDVIDGYLADWLTGGYYEGRAVTGRYQGATIMRALGAKAGERLIAEANRVLATPDADGRRRKIGDQLLFGLAASGSPDAVKLVLDIAAMDRGDATLSERALNAVYKAYLDPGGLFLAADPAALGPSLDRLGAIARDDSQPSRVANDAVELIRAAGLPGCLDPLLAMVNQPHQDPRFRWVGANNAIRCGGAKALTAVATQLSTAGSYQQTVLTGAVVAPLPSVGDRDGLVAAARDLLTNPSWVARWIGVEALGALASKADADRLQAMAGDKAKLAGYWGDQSQLPKKEQKPVPTLGQRATEVAAALR
ncbi:MAG: hypothetical protein R3B06_18990 [Kofleriaceae bacterium]